MDIAHLESGQAGRLERAQLEALAKALEWNVGMLVVASGGQTPTAGDSALTGDDAEIIYLHPRDQLEMIREEVAGLRALHDALQEWREGLAVRISILTSSPPEVDTDPRPDA